jgi:hypothetical protein
MRLAGSTRRLAAWIAALAVLMAALAPALSHAMAAEQAARWIEVCGAQGSKWIAGDDASGAPKTLHGLELCPYCTLHAQTACLPPLVATVAAAASLRDVVPHARPVVPRPLPAWLNAQPRAPPRFS